MTIQEIKKEIKTQLDTEITAINKRTGNKVKYRKRYDKFLTTYTEFVLLNLGKEGAFEHFGVVIVISFKNARIQRFSVKKNKELLHGVSYHISHDSYYEEIHQQSL